MKYSLHYILSKKFLHRQFTLRGDELSGLEIHDDGKPITLAELEQADKELQGLQYITDRKKAMPEIGDQLDALWHAMDKGILPKVDAFYKPIAEVKKTNPKG